MNIIKNSVEICMKEITFIINYCIEDEISPDDLKLALVSPTASAPIIKKEYSFNKQNYRPLDMLPNLFKAFERILYK